MAKARKRNAGDDFGVRRLRLRFQRFVHVPDVTRMVFEQKSFSSVSCFKKSKKFLAEDCISGHTAIRAKEGPFKRGDSCALDHFYNHRLRPDAGTSQACGNGQPTTTGEKGFRSGRNQGNT